MMRSPLHLLGLALRRSASDRCHSYATWSAHYLEQVHFGSHAGYEAMAVFYLCFAASRMVGRRAGSIWKEQRGEAEGEGGTVSEGLQPARIFNG